VLERQRFSTVAVTSKDYKNIPKKLRIRVELEIAGHCERAVRQAQAARLGQQIHFLSRLSESREDQPPYANVMRAGNIDLLCWP
jgi:hypothetical protein